MILAALYDHRDRELVGGGYDRRPLDANGHADFGPATAEWRPIYGIRVYLGQAYVEIMTTQQGSLLMPAQRLQLNLKAWPCPSCATMVEVETRYGCCLRARIMQELLYQ